MLAARDMLGGHAFFAWREGMQLLLTRWAPLALALSIAAVGCGGHGSGSSRSAGSTAGAVTSGAPSAAPITTSAGGFGPLAPGALAAAPTAGPGGGVPLRSGATGGATAGATGGPAAGATAPPTGGPAGSSGALPGGSAGAPTGSPPSSGSSGGSAVSVFTVTALPLAHATASPGSWAVPLRLRLEAPPSQAIELRALTVDSTGRVDEPQVIGALELVQDDDQDGAPDAGEPRLARASAPAFSRNNGEVTLTLTSPLTIPAGGEVELLVAGEVVASGSAALVAAGRDFTLEVVLASHVDASATPAGSFPLEGSVAIELTPHLLISEVSFASSGAFVELYNPTSQAIDLTDVYLTDYWRDDEGYYLLPSGRDFRPGLFSGDFLVRFPAGASAPPGRTVVIAINGHDYEATHWVRPDFALGASQGNEQMLSPTDDNPPQWRDSAPWTLSLRLRPSGEGLVLFTWDGVSDLVRDIDYVFWGEAGSGDSNAELDKSGKTVDGPDADSTPSAYPRETPAGQQRPAPHVSWTTYPEDAIQRIDFSEAGELRSGGNGVGGHEETSEAFDATFRLGVSLPAVP